MIHDTLDQFSRYAALHTRFEKITKWLEQTNLGTLPLGRHDILPNGEAFANVQEIECRNRDQIPAEYHRTSHSSICPPRTGSPSSPASLWSSSQPMSTPPAM